MDYTIIGFEKKEYKDAIYKPKFYLHVAEYPHIINVSENIYKDCIGKSVVTFPILTISCYEGKHYYKYTGKE